MKKKIIFLFFFFNIFFEVYIHNENFSIEKRIYDRTFFFFNSNQWKAFQTRIQENNSQLNNIVVLTNTQLECFFTYIFFTFPNHYKSSDDNYKQNIIICNICFSFLVIRNSLLGTLNEDGHFSWVWNNMMMFCILAF
jgi:hypothetical protein